MQIVLTGSLGNIGSPLAQKLVKQGHNVTVISSNEEKRPAIAAIGAKAAIGRMQDVDFLTKTFTGADIVYCMESLGDNFLFDKEFDMISANIQIGRNYAQAIAASGVRKVIHLSAMGAHTNKGVGFLKFHYEVEQVLRALPDAVSIKFMRPVAFYSNTLSFIQTIKYQNAIFQNYAGDVLEPWVSPADIADAIAEEMEKPFEGRTVRYIASDEISPDEMVKILGAAIGKPELAWVQVSDEQLTGPLLAAGMNEQLVNGMVEINAAKTSGALYEDYHKHHPVLSKVKFKDFAQVFASIYDQA